MSPLPNRIGSAQTDIGRMGDSPILSPRSNDGSGTSRPSSRSSTGHRHHIRSPK